MTTDFSRVLFLCTHNSARSQMAEGLLRNLTGRAVKVYSAGNKATFVRLEAVEVMREIGIDISWHCSKTLNRFIQDRFDFVITVCDDANEACPIFPNAVNRRHWSIDDPSAVEGSKSEKMKAFRVVRDELKKRVERELIPNIPWRPTSVARIHHKKSDFLNMFGLVMQLMFGVEMKSSKSKAKLWILIAVVIMVVIALFIQVDWIADTYDEVKRSRVEDPDAPLPWESPGDRSVTAPSIDSLNTIFLVNHRAKTIIRCVPVREGDMVEDVLHFLTTNDTKILEQGLEWVNPCPAGYRWK